MCALFAQDAEVIIYETTIHATPNSKEEDVEIILQINNRMGEINNEFTLFYSGKEKIKSLDVTLEDMSGNVIRKIKSKEIRDVNHVTNYSLYTDDFIRYFEPKHNIYPYRIRVKYSKVYSEFMLVASWIPLKTYKIPTKAARLTLKTPVGYGLHYRQQNIDPPKIEEINGEIIHSWEGSYNDLLEYEAYPPHYLELVPFVEIVPDNFDYGIPGSFESWNSFGQWAFDLGSDLDELTMEERGRISSLLLGTEDTKQKVAVLYNYLQENTRYVNVSINLGGFKPYPASYVCNTRYGDCKALTNYMKALLAFAGINSYYTLIYLDDPGLPVIPDFPSQHFNHAILTVPLEPDTLFLECTSKSLPMGYIHAEIQNRYALLVDDQQSRLIKIPAWDSLYLSTYVTRYQRITNENYHQRTEITARGIDFEYWNAIANNSSAHDAESEIRKTFSEPGKNLTQWNIKESFPDSTSVQAYIEYEANNLLKDYGSEVIWRISPLPLPHFESPADRKSPVQISFPIGKEEKVFLELPDSFEKIVFPENVSLKSPFGSYELHFYRKKNLLVMDRKFHLNPGYYSTTGYNDFYSFIMDIKELEKRNAVVILK